MSLTKFLLRLSVQSIIIPQNDSLNRKFWFELSFKIHGFHKINASIKYINCSIFLFLTQRLSGSFLSLLDRFGLKGSSQFHFYLVATILPIIANFIMSQAKYQFKL